MRFPVSMQRLRVAAVMLLAVVLAAQLTLHDHSLIPEGGASPALACSVCAFGADPARTSVPVAGFLLVLAFLLVTREQTVHACACAARTALADSARRSIGDRAKNLLRIRPTPIRLLTEPHSFRLACRSR